MKRSGPQSDYSFVHKVFLSISILLFLFVFAYWFLDINSPASLVNLIMEKAIDPTKYPRRTGGIGWLRFLLHFGITAYALFLFYKSCAAKWLGIKIALCTPISNFLHENYARSKALKVGLQLVLGLGLIYTIYEFIMGVVAGSEVPVEVFQYFLFYYFVNLVVWEINFSKPLQLPDLAGMCDKRDEVFWIRLTPNQIAYVQDRANENVWRLIKDSDANLSYAVSYIFNTLKFNISLKNQTLIKNNFGEIKYDSQVTLYGLNTEHTDEDYLIIKNFPPRLTANQITSLNELTQESTAIKMLNTLIYQTGTVQKLEDNITSLAVEVAKFTDQTSAIKDFDWKHEYQRIYKKLERNSISSMLRADFQQLFDGIFPELFRIHVSVVHDSVHTTFRQEIRLFKTRVDQQEAQDKSIDQKRITTLQEKIAEQVGRLGKTPKEVQDFLRMALELPSSNGTTVQHKPSNGMLLNDLPEKGIKSALEDAVDVIHNAIRDGNKNGYSNADIKEKIARETSFFKEHQIAPEHFFECLFLKMNTEGEERTEEAKKQLVQDTLAELYIRKS
ncbi:hypothetical protein N9954_06855 [Maribacter sp.]|nr:hypothetical protein [Maribacter sp.]